MAIKFDDHAIDVSFTKTSLHFVLADGREISAPLEWFPRLRDATDVERQEWRFIGNGLGGHFSRCFDAWNRLIYFVYKLSGNFNDSDLEPLAGN